VVNQDLGRPADLRDRPVVFRELDDLAVGVSLPVGEDVLVGTAAEGVDGLIIVPHDQGVFDSQGKEQLVLQAR